MSRQGGDNHFISAREQDLKSLLDEGRDELDLDQDKGQMLEAFLETCWLAGTRSGHARLLNQAIRQREEQADEELDDPVEPIPLQPLEAEFKATMEAAAEALDLPMAGTVSLWDLLTRAWTAGVRTYESEVMASLIERKSDLADEAQRWLADDEELP